MRCSKQEYQNFLEKWRKLVGEHDRHQLPISIQGAQLLPVASLEFSLAGEKTTVTAFFWKFHLTTVTCLCSSAQILMCALNTLLKQLTCNVYFAGVPLFAPLPLLPSVRLPHWCFLQGKHQLWQNSRNLGSQPLPPPALKRFVSASF